MKRLIFISLAVVVIPTILFLFVGCLKVPEAKVDFGPEVGAKDVQAALQKLDGASALEVRKGDFIYLETSVRIESQAPQVVRQQAHTVVDRTESDDSILLNIVKRLVEMSSGSSKTSATEYAIKLKKTSSVAPAQLVASAMDATSPVGSVLQKFGESGSASNDVFLNGLKVLATDTVSVLEGSTRVTFHNLAVEKVNLGIPLLVQMRENCGGMGVNVCNAGVNGVRVRLDQVVWEDGKPNKTSFVWTGSQEVPPLAGQFASCAHSLVPYQGAVYNVLQCEEVKDFIKGANVLPHE